MPRPTKQAPPKKAELERLRSKGLTRAELAEHYNVPLSTIKRWITELKVKPLPPGVVPRRKKPKKEPTLEEGYTLIEIAQFRLGKRLTEDWRGYLLDGKPCNVSDILEAADLEGKAK